jgi:hypothetical protein
MQRLVTLLETHPQEVSHFLHSSDAEEIGSKELCLACCYLVRTKSPEDTTRLNEVQSIRQSVVQADLKRIDKALLKLCASTDDTHLLDFLESNKCELTEFTFSLCALAASSGSQRVFSRLLQHLSLTPLQRKRLLDLTVYAGFSNPEDENLADAHTFKRACESGNRDLVLRFRSVAPCDAFNIAIRTGMIQSEEDLAMFNAAQNIDGAMIEAAKRGYFETISILLRCSTGSQKPSQTTIYHITCSAIDFGEDDFFEFLLGKIEDKRLYFNLLRHAALLDNDNVLEQILWVCDPLDRVSYRKVLNTARQAGSQKCRKILEEGPYSTGFFALRPFLNIPPSETH